MEKINSAVIGCGRMGAFTSDSVLQFSPSCWLPLSHAEALQLHPKINLNALCDVNETLLGKAKLQYQVANSYTDFEVMLEAIKPELLCIATRTPDRPAIIQQGIAAGVKAFHIEKPLCNSVIQLNDLEKLTQAHNILLSYGTVRRYFSVYKMAKELVESGKWGRLKQVQINFGSAPLFWTHPHSVDLLLFFAGKTSILDCQATLENVVYGESPHYIQSDPILTMGSVRFDNGVTGLITQANGMDVVLSCETGELTVLADGRGIVCREAKGDDPYFIYPGEKKPIPEVGKEGSYAAISALVAALDNEDNFDKQHIFSGQRILFTFMQSHHMGGHRVVMHDLIEDWFIMAQSGPYVA
jgi:scyllo-inositol 2-dehydrogenase (NAD+)